MCGLVAIMSHAAPIPQASINRALESLRSRGPDGEGTWLDADRTVALGHTRLSVIAPQNGHQPLANEDGTIHAVVTGEFYGFAAVKAELVAKGHHFKTGSDSEILIHLFEENGFDCLKYLRGEFAFVLWDSRVRTLFAARDRFGIKPLFYIQSPQDVRLASDAKAIFATGVGARWNEEAVHRQLFAYLPQEETLFLGVKQVPAGHFLIARREGIALHAYWDLDYPDRRVRHTIDEGDAVEAFRYGLDEAVRIRLQSDVPVTCLLSGGVDSSTALGVAVRHPEAPRRAFTVRFESESFNEASAAQEIGGQLGVDVVQVPISQGQLGERMVEAIKHGEAPTLNGHGIARYLLARAVSDQGYKVAITGDGADELLGGYVFAHRDLVAEVDDCAPAGAHPKALHGVAGLLGFVPSWMQELAISRSVFHTVLAPDFARRFESLDVYGELVRDCGRYDRLKDRHPLDISSHLWSKSVLVNYALVSERLEMANGLETRLPYLDHHLFDLTRKLPLGMLVRPGEQKYVLRQVARRYLSAQSAMRLKHPFAAPPSTLHGSDRFHDFLQTVLRSDAMDQVPFFDREKIRHLLTALPLVSASTRAKLDSALTLAASMVLLHQCFGLST